MTSILTHLLAVAVGVVCTWSYARREIAKIKRDDLSFRMARTISNSVEDAARRVGA